MSEATAMVVISFGFLLFVAVLAWRFNDSPVQTIDLNALEIQQDSIDKVSEWLSHKDDRWNAVEREKPIPLGKKEFLITELLAAGLDPTKLTGLEIK